MSDILGRDPMLDMFIFETTQLIEQLEQIILSSEKSNGMEASINEIFRIMHTIKGSSAMMLFNDISTLAHSIEDLFYFIREKNPQNVNFARLTDIILEGIDFIKNEISKIEAGLSPDGDASGLAAEIKGFLFSLKNEENAEEHSEDDNKTNIGQKYYSSPLSTGKDTEIFKYSAIVWFEEGCEMESVRAFTVIHDLKDIAMDINTIPENIIDDESSTEIIKRDGFRIWFNSVYPMGKVREILDKTFFLSKLKLEYAGEVESAKAPSGKLKIDLDETQAIPLDEGKHVKVQEKVNNSIINKQGFISVGISKMDMLMDLVGELVISEALVTQNPDLKDLQLDNFYKAAGQHRKVIGELQDIVMSVRMVPLAMTFQKMNRIVRDMSKKLSKEIELEIIGEETEVDKNIIEHISDPLMHLIRNAIDHGIETAEERVLAGKTEAGRIILEAKNSGGDVWITVKDDGKGLDKEKILSKARKNGLISKPENELTDKEIYSFILLPGFSTKESVTEFSGRGVGMDVVTKNIEEIGGTLLVDSIQGAGTVVSVKIPLTLAIINGMTVKVGGSVYTIPTVSTKESFRPRKEDVIRDTEDNEMMLIRGASYPVLRLHELYKIKSAVTEISEGIIIMVEEDSKGLCLFADALLGEQQVVVKALPGYIKKVKGISGCTLLGDGSISLILDIAALIK